VGTIGTPGIVLRAAIGFMAVNVCLSDMGVVPLFHTFFILTTRLACLTAAAITSPPAS
jgi:hypothetical protein